MALRLSQELSVQTDVIGTCIIYTYKTIILYLGWSRLGAYLHCLLILLSNPIFRSQYHSMSDWVVWRPTRNRKTSDRLTSISTASWSESSCSKSSVPHSSAASRAWSMCDSASEPFSRRTLIHPLRVNMYFTGANRALEYVSFNQLVIKQPNQTCVWWALRGYRGSFYWCCSSSTRCRGSSTIFLYSSNQLTWSNRPNYELALHIQEFLQLFPFRLQPCQSLRRGSAEIWRNIP